MSRSHCRVERYPKSGVEQYASRTDLHDGIHDCGRCIARPKQTWFAEVLVSYIAESEIDEGLLDHGPSRQCTRVTSSNKNPWRLVWLDIVTIRHRQYHILSKVLQVIDGLLDLDIMIRGRTEIRSSRMRTVRYLRDSSFRSPKG